MFKVSKKALHARSVKVFRRKAPASITTRNVPSGAVKHEKKSKRVILLFAVGVLFFAAALAVFYFQSLLPHITLNSGTVVSPASSLKDVNLLQDELKKNNIAFDSVSEATTSPSFVVSLKDGSYAYMSKTENISSQAKLLSSILSRIAIESPNKKLKYIDLRFDKAVIKF